MERGTLLICIFSIFSIFVQDVPHYNHAAGSQASMIIGKTLALISLRGVVSSQRVHGVFFETTLLATGSSYGKTPCPHHEGGNHLIVTIVKECAFMASTDIRHSHHIPAEFYSRKGGGTLISTAEFYSRISTTTAQQHRHYQQHSLTDIRGGDPYTHCGVTSTHAWGGFLYPPRSSTHV
jgi:hypothetical protein